VDEAPPAFVVGCQRSGTTLIRLMLDSHPNISCGPETRFLGELARLTDEHWPRLSLYGFPKEYWNEQVARLFGGFQSDYARSRNKTRWVDKTPRYALILPFILEVFPRAQIIHVVRDGRAVVASHKSRFGYWSAVKAVEKWPRYIRAVREISSTLPAEQHLEVHYERLVADPEATMREVLQFLGEDWDPAVLDYRSVEHAVMAHYGTFSEGRRAAGGTSEALYNSRIAGWKKEIDPLLRAAIALRGRRTLRELGYK
jgi:Sulfotransferase family